MLFRICTLVKILLYMTLLLNAHLLTGIFYLLYRLYFRGPYMSAHVLLELLNELGNKCQVLL